MAGGPSVDPWMSWIHRWPRTDPSPSLGPPEAANGLRGPWDLRRLPGPNSLFECYVRVARPGGEDGLHGNCGDGVVLGTINLES